mmetsp:Transcript_17103/g.49091  ORF Transcript_17103/g.49091 Transcript_17103/m.49091 type:complete len:164 (-) Transcript_17103:1136-1627(-)|eukprot:CAMPEP_0181030826 /NCGR_PEP_ID=MMETSP1070-20121207/5922_1 /TAXON_ID=265543 /ORGANISM="Minutocellus polymorphus, Strain NH13" /LENGTH=163 /DNA_ID=CAMNT_0023108195 /DNA_START=225 /DNA_END=716 /DNA_ORIENTATION=-
MRRPRPNFLSDGPKFAKFVAVTTVASLGLGYACLLYVERRNPSAAADSISAADTATPSRDEALVRAMIQNAKESSWRENLSNAIMAQERFVLPERHPARESSGEHDESRQANPKDLFVRKLVERSDRWLEEQQAQIERRKQRRQEVDNFSTTWGGQNEGNNET